VVSGVAISIVIFIAGVSNLGYLNAGGELCKSESNSVQVVKTLPPLEGSISKLGFL